MQTKKKRTLLRMSGVDNNTNLLDDVLYFATVSLFYSLIIQALFAPLRDLWITLDLLITLLFIVSL